jgi:hypothetical protein
MNVAPFNPSHSEVRAPVREEGMDKGNIEGTFLGERRNNAVSPGLVNGAGSGICRRRHINASNGSRSSR